MNRQREGQELPSLTQEKLQSLKHIQEILFLAEQAAEGKLKILPGGEWALHYPISSEARTEKLQGLLKGKYTFQEVASEVKPDALFYNLEDLENQGLEKVNAKIRNLSAFIEYYDYLRFAQFIESMRDCGISLQDLENLYQDIAQASIQKKLIDVYGYAGREQIKKALRLEAESILEGIEDLPRSQKVLKALKINWLKEELNLVAMEERDQVISKLSGDERQLFESLQASYRDYVQKGDEKGYKGIVEIIQKEFPKIQRKPEADKSSKSMQKLEKELESFRNQIGLPGSSEDLAIPPDDAEEYHTPPPSLERSKEKIRELPIFEIKPPLGGYYIKGRKSYFNKKTKTWSKRKQLSPYSISIKGEKRYTISGILNKGLKTLPLPNGYGLDIVSLKFRGACPEIFRDQNGCFYLKTEEESSFSIDFLQELESFIGPPIPEDTAQLSQRSLSSKTEEMISQLIGTSLQKAEQIRQYILANHFYPGGGDRQIAQALQHKLRTESTEDDYLQNIDNSEYLECYSANTLFIAIMRRIGIPARLVLGDKVEELKGGKAVITQNTGHAWSEIWDNKTWRRFDATPDLKPEDRKEPEKKKGRLPEEAQNGGVEKPQERKLEEKPLLEPENPLKGMIDALDKDLKQAETQFQQMKEQMEQMLQQKQELIEKMQKIEKFQELAELQKEIEESELLDDFKKELKEKLETKKEQMKEKIEDTLETMVEEGFMEEEQQKEILEKLERKKLEELDCLQKEVEQENKLYNEYEDIQKEVKPLVDEWFRYFAERLPREEEMEFDEDSLTRRGAFDRKAIMRWRNLLFGLTKNPKVIEPLIKPKFIASLVLDVSGSMEGRKLRNARKLLIFCSELFSIISRLFGYIRFSIDIFSDTVVKIKGFEQDYDSPQRYEYENGTKSTVKVRLMKQLIARGGTNMLEAIKKAAAELSKEVYEYPSYVSALYFMGDGEDTYGNATNIRNFLRINEAEKGFGGHMYSAILLGDESQRQQLAEIFGDEHTNVASDFDELIEQSMLKFDEDIKEYLKDKTS